jgi:catechol 2,3-dioxygenase-like lactoylglutathione lyase family enzyme
MPSGIVKAVVLVDDLDATLHFLEDIAGLRPVTRFESTGEMAAAGLGWPAEHGATRGAMVGQRQGMLELVEIPPALRDTLRPGVAGLSVATRDVEAPTQVASDAGFPVVGPYDLVGVDETVSTIARIEAGGVPFELIRFGSPVPELPAPQASPDKEKAG